MTAWRHRRCSRCGSVFPAGELKVLRPGAGHWHKKGGSLRRCPSCNVVDFTSRFPTVRDKRRVDYAMMN